MKIQSPLWWRKWRARRWIERDRAYQDKRVSFTIGSFSFTSKSIGEFLNLESPEVRARRRFEIPEGEEL